MLGYLLEIAGQCNQKLTPSDFICPSFREKHVLKRDKVWCVRQPPNYKLKTLVEDYGGRNGWGSEFHKQEYSTGWTIYQRLSSCPSRLPSTTIQLWQPLWLHWRSLSYTQCGISFRGNDVGQCWRAFFPAYISWVAVESSALWACSKLGCGWLVYYWLVKFMYLA